MPHQENLFGSSRVDEIRKKVKELDGMINKAMKHKEFAKAKSFTEEQERLIQILVAGPDDHMTG